MWSFFFLSFFLSVPRVETRSELISGPPPVFAKKSRVHPAGWTAELCLCLMSKYYLNWTSSRERGRVRRLYCDEGKCLLSEPFTGRHNDWIFSFLSIS